MAGLMEGVKNFASGAVNFVKNNWKGALAGLAGPAINAASSVYNTYQQGKANQANVASQQQTNQAATDLWREQMAYNHPTQQMARLKEAGLNPNLIYGSGSSAAAGNSSSLPSLNAPHMDPKRSIIDPSLGVSSMAMYFQMLNMQAQNENLRAQNSLIHSQQQYYDMHTRYESGKLSKIPYETGKIQAETSSAQASAASAKHNLKTVENTLIPTTGANPFNLGSRILWDLGSRLLNGMKQGMQPNSFVGKKFNKK